jgi:hypothetical protein
VQRTVLRLLRRASQPLATGEVLRLVGCPALRRGRPDAKHYERIRRVLDRFATRVGRRPGRSILWRIRDEFRR